MAGLSRPSQTLGHRQHDRCGACGLEQSYLSDVSLQSRRDAPVVLMLEGLSRANAYQDVSLQVHGGEILGIYGFLGAGQLDWRAPCSVSCRRNEDVLCWMGLLPPIGDRARQKRRYRGSIGSRRMMLSAAEPVFKNVTIAILDRIHPVWLQPKAEPR